MTNKFQFTTNDYLAKELRQVIIKYESMSKCLQKAAEFIVKLSKYDISIDFALVHVKDIAECLLNKKEG